MTFLYLLRALWLCDEASAESKATSKKLCHPILGTREIVASGCLNVGLNWFRRAPIPPEKQILIYLWMLANGDETSRQVADRLDVTMSSCRRVLRKVNTAILSMLPRYLKWPNGETTLFSPFIVTHN